MKITSKSLRKAGIHLKKILVLFLLISLFYIGFQNLDKISWLGNQNSPVNVSNHIDLIKFDISGIRTTIIPENRNDLVAELKGKGKVIVKENGDSISVQYKRKWFDWLSFFDKSKLTIYIPEDYHQDMNIKVGSGNVNYDGMSSELDNLKVDMVSGNIHLNNLKVNQFEHTSSSGNTVANSLSTKTGSFHLSSGNIILNRYHGKLKANLSSGNFKVQMDKLTNDVDIHVSSGNMLLDLPGDADFTINGDINSGIISNNFPLKNQSENSKHLEGIHGSGKYNIDLGVSSGRIRIY
jgi:lia operon protein LiaG